MEEHYKKQKENIQRMHTHFGPVKYDFCPSSACFGAQSNWTSTTCKDGLSKNDLTSKLGNFEKLLREITTNWG